MILKTDFSCHSLTVSASELVVSVAAAGDKSGNFAVWEMVTMS